LTEGSETILWRKQGKLVGPPSDVNSDGGFFIKTNRKNKYSISKRLLFNPIYSLCLFKKKGFHVSEKTKKIIKLVIILAIAFVLVAILVSQGRAGIV
jgi:hypothetical protein